MVDYDEFYAKIRKQKVEKVNDYRKSMTWILNNLRDGPKILSEINNGKEAGSMFSLAYNTLDFMGGIEAVELGGKSYVGLSRNLKHRIMEDGTSYVVGESVQILKEYLIGPQKFRETLEKNGTEGEYRWLPNDWLYGE